MKRARVVIFVERADWHAGRLTAAFAARGVEAVCVSLRDCRFGGTDGTGVVLPGFEDAPPDGALVRSIAAGSFEQVTLRLSLLHALHQLGVPVCNDARAIERCVDKAMATFLLQRAGLPTPPTWVCESWRQAAAVTAREAAPGAPLVLKPLFGAQGRGLRLIEAAADLPPEEEVDGVYYLQRYVFTAGPGWRDMRVLVAAGGAVAAMTRHGKGWITNAKQGAACEALPLDERLAGLATAAARVVGAGYAGVDIIRDRDGCAFVLEVNSMPAWGALQRVSGANIAQAVADSLLIRLRRDATVLPLSSAAAG